MEQRARTPQERRAPTDPRRQSRLPPKRTRFQFLQLVQSTRPATRIQAAREPQALLGEAFGRVKQLQGATPLFEGEGQKKQATSPTSKMRAHRHLSLV